MGEREGLASLRRALRALEHRAVAARRAAGQSASRRAAARDVGRRNLHPSGLDARRIGEWLGEPGRAPRDPDQVWALVRVWADWAGDPGQRQQYWARLVEQAQPVSPRHAHNRPGPAGPERPAQVGDPRNWIRLGVHAPITVLSTGEDLTDEVRAGELPAYVLREADRLQLRPVLEAAERGEDPPVRLVVIVGESAAGKSRMAAEAAQAVLSDWTLAVPRSSADLEALHEGHPPPRRVLVWLDEIQHLLIQVGATEALLKLLDLPAGPVVLLATLRTDAEQALYGSPGWQLLDRAECRILVHRRPNGAEFRTELARANELDDPWIREALAKIGDRYGIAEWLAAGPQLLRHLERARTRDNDPVVRIGAALVDAAIDCYRAGYMDPIPEPLLTEVHPLYLHATDPVPGSRSDPTVFPAAMAWARLPVAGATGLLVHHRDRGDIAFDYLLGYASRPEAPPIAGGLWAILSRHLTPGTLATVGIAANRSGRSDLALELADRLSDVDLYAELGYRVSLERLAEGGDGVAKDRLAQLLADRGETAELERRADDDMEYDGVYSMALALLLAKRGDETELERRANADMYAAWHLASLLFERGDEAGLERFADAGDQEATNLAEFAAELLAELLAGRGDEAGLARRAEVGDRFAAGQLADLLAMRGGRAGVHVGDMEPAAQLPERSDLAELRRRAGTGDIPAIVELVDLLSARGDVSELQCRADTGDRYAAEQLSRLLAARGVEDALERRANTGDRYAANQLAELAFRLAERGDEAGLARRADTGDRYAAEHLAGLLAERGDEGGLQRRANTGDQDAASRLAKLLFERGDEAGLERRAAAGDQDAARRLTALLSGRGDEPGLERRAATGDQDAARRLAALLFERGDHAALEHLANGGDRAAAWRLGKLMFERSDLAGLKRRAAAGDQAAVGWLNGLLFKRGDHAALEHLANGGDRAAAWWLGKLMFERGDLAGLKRRADAGDQAAAPRLANLLFARRDEAGLSHQAEGGSQYAARRLAVLLYERGDLAELERRAAAGDRVAAELARLRGIGGRRHG